MKQGFTLIELLVVVLIIGILSSVALPQYTKAVEKARATEAIQLLGDMATAEQIYQMGMGTYTSDLSMLDLQLPGVGSTATSTVATKNFNITATAPDSSATFKAYAVRATNGTNNTSDPAYAIIINIDASGTITQWCGATSSTVRGAANSNKFCKAIANNASGTIR